MTESEWLACTDPDKMLQYSHKKPSERKRRLFCCACCRRLWSLLTDQRSRKVIEVTELYVDGLTSKKEMDAAQAAAAAASKEVAEMAPPPRPNRRETRAGLMAVEAAWAAPRLSKLSAQFARRAVWEAGQAEEEAFQCEILRDLFGNPFRPVSIEPSWLTPTVTSLATAAYEERELPSGHLDAARLGVLTDALEGAGCDNAEILTHCCSGGEHVRGCWVVDLLLGKE
jgi:hypothetical protein